MTELQVALDAAIWARHSEFTPNGWTEATACHTCRDDYSTHRLVLWPCEHEVMRRALDAARAERDAARATMRATRAVVFKAREVAIQAGQAGLFDILTDIDNALADALAAHRGSGEARDADD